VSQIRYPGVRSLMFEDRKHDSLHRLSLNPCSVGCNTLECKSPFVEYMTLQYVSANRWSKEYSLVLIDAFKQEFTFLVPRMLR